MLAAVVESSDAAIITTDIRGLILTWSRGAERLYGYEGQEIEGRSIALLIPDDRQDELDTLLERVRTGMRVERYETVRRAKGGPLVEVSVTASPIADAAGRIVRAMIVESDISARTRADLALRTSESRWRSLIESAVDGIVVIDAHARIEVFSPAAERLFGYRQDEVAGKNVNILMPSPYHEEHDGYIGQYLTTGMQKIIGIGRDVTARRRDGTTFPVHLAVGEMTVGGEQKFTGIIQDLSGRVRIEEQLREQTAMARLGEMAALIAHEVKNPLAGIRGAIQVIGGRLPSESRDAAVAKEILTRIDALNDLMKDLLLFARPPQPRPMPVDLAALVTATADLLTEDPGVGGVRFEIDGSAPPVMADAELLKIVFSNVLVNAAHAMHGQGVVHVSIRALDGVCRVAFQDSGPGIAPDIREKIFTPFFTTKSRGTGLGLSTARQLVEAHAGTIYVECPAGGGTTVTVQLPASASPV